MALEAERRLVGQRNALQRAVEERNVRDTHVARQARRIDSEAMVLAGDQDLSRILVEHRVIGAVMAELHLHRLAATRHTEQLVTEADAEGRYAHADELANRIDGVVAGLGVAGAI